jgi:hypothetical protein
VKSAVVLVPDVVVEVEGIGRAHSIEEFVVSQYLDLLVDEECTFGFVVGGYKPAYSAAK